MAVVLSKGGNVSLSKQDANLKVLRVGLGWDARATDGADFDLDAVAFLLGANGKVARDEDFIFYNNLRSVDGSVEHTGDNRTGDAVGDDESLIFKLDQVPASVTRIVIAVTIHEASQRRQNFGQVQNAYVRCVNDQTNQELARFDLSEDASVETAMIFAEVYRYNNEWKFKAVQQGFGGGLAPLASSYGVNV